MLENKLTATNFKATTKTMKGMNAIAQNPNMPSQIKNVVLTQTLLQPLPITGHLPRW